MNNNSAKQSYFVAGTDTDAGKTLISCALLAKAKANGLTTAAVKPVAAGCHETPDGLRNDDALMLMEQCSVPLYYEQVNPVAFAPAIAPHIAAQTLGKRMQVDRLSGFCRGVTMQGAQFTLIEGAGGWRVPVNERETLADLAKLLNHPIILVVGMRLGCINHALLTVEAIVNDGLNLAGWVANCVDPNMSVLNANIDTLVQRINAPLLGVVPSLSHDLDHAAKVQIAQQHLDLNMLTPKSRD